MMVLKFHFLFFFFLFVTMNNKNRIHFKRKFSEPLFASLVTPIGAADVVAKLVDALFARIEDGVAIDELTSAPASAIEQTLLVLLLVLNGKLERTPSVQKLFVRKKRRLLFFLFWTIFIIIFLCRTTRGTTATTKTTTANVEQQMLFFKHTCLAKGLDSTINVS